MRVCFLGTYEKNYPRNQILLKALRRAGIEVIHCHIDIWKRKTHKTDMLKNAAYLLGFIGRLIFTYPFLWASYLTQPRHDAVLIGYPGHIDTLAMNWLVKLRRKPLIFDCFISLYDSAANDRSLVKPGSFLARLIFCLDRWACRAADRVLLDTEAQIDYFSRTFNIERNRFVRIFAGADDELFQTPSPSPLPLSGGEDKGEGVIYRVLFIGKFIPFHGIDTIVEAAKILQSHADIRLDFIGTGQLFEKIESKVKSLGLRNVKLHGWVEYGELPAWIRQSDLCLGIFSNSEKADRVIPNKIFQALACGKPVVTARTRAARELLKENESAYFVSPENPGELARVILEAARNQDLTERIGASGKRAFERSANLEVTGNQLKALFDPLTLPSPPARGRGLKVRGFLWSVLL